MSTANTARPHLRFAACASKVDVLSKHLLSSPCLHSGGYPLSVAFNATSAAEAFNAAMLVAESQMTGESWLVWVHQDVVLPSGWDAQFIGAVAAAKEQFLGLAVVGVYGVGGTGASMQRAGHVLDRGNLLQEPTPLPCLVDSLDELLFAVRVGSGLQLDPALGFDFYATDLVLQAQANGYQCAVVDAYCEHWSNSPTHGTMPHGVVERVRANGVVFEQKWQAQLPITTPCFEINQPGDVARAIAAIVSATH